MVQDHKGGLYLQYEGYSQPFVALDFYDNNLTEHGAKFAAGGRDAVEGAAVGGWECFCWDLLTFFNKGVLRFRPP